MWSYCLKCKKDTECISPKVLKPVIEKYFLYLNMQCVIVRNQDLREIKKKVGYQSSFD